MLQHCKHSSCVHVDSTLDAVDPVHTGATVQFAVSAQQCPLHGRAQGQGHGRAWRVHAVASAVYSTECRPVARWEPRTRSAHGAGPERSRSDPRATTEHVTERSRSDHGLARNATTEQPGAPPRSGSAAPPRSGSVLPRAERRTEQAQSSSMTRRVIPAKAEELLGEDTNLDAEKPHAD